MVLGLGEKQELFARLVPMLIQRAHFLGFEVRLGDCFRDPRTNGEFGTKLGYSSSKSCHKLKLAIDLNLFKNKKFMSKTEDHWALGKWWKEQHPLCRWGGDFDDGNHYSLEHNGVK